MGFTMVDRQRREFFRSIFSSATEMVGDAIESKTKSIEEAVEAATSKPASVKQSSNAPPLPVLRPPYAAPGDLFLQRCTKCEDCISACPHEAIRKAPLRLRQAGGTPVIDPFQQACKMCEDFPCVEACEEDALSFEYTSRMGLAQIIGPDCLGVQRLGCSVCSEQCPVECAIIREKGIPKIISEVCTGCGVCQQLCPAPRNAILITPVM